MFQPANVHGEWQRKEESGGSHQTRMTAWRTVIGKREGIFMVRRK